ncbi:MAG TPA: DivIVA domain-containing protein [Gaiellaceae bacterium]|nr:DivIVA domain-containing protein [Gaiellaceae bacterium]
MSFTPVEIRHVRLKRGLFGYRRSHVDQLLEEVSASFETVWRDRADNADRVELLEGELTRFRELESLLRTTLMSAERAAHELKAQAKREAETILAEAQAEARTITRKARSDHELLTGEARRLRLRLHAALDAIEDGVEDEPAASTVRHEPPARETRAA